jgi:hypothetical protein
MASTVVVDSAVTQISAALQYDDCERLLAEGAPLDSAYKLAVAQGQAAYNKDYGPDSTRETVAVMQVAA